MAKLVRSLPSSSAKSSSSATPAQDSSNASLTKHQADLALLYRIAKRALYYSTQMIHLANNRDDVQKGDPKIGGHPAACASLTHIMGALHLMVREPQDHMAVKPHGSPMDHAYHHLLKMFFHRDGRPFGEDEAKGVMTRLRKFADPEQPGSEPVFQSYHAAWDPDSFNYFPSGTVGIPPVASAYMALAYRFAQDHGFEVPAQAHFWSIIGDSEFREGSLHECIPDVAERHLGNVTWIVDYNRQNLDGARIKAGDLTGTDADRIERLGLANGWVVHNLRHGSKRLSMFRAPGGDALQRIFERHLSDSELQALLLAKDAQIVRQRFKELEPSAGKFFDKIKDQELLELLTDLGGHDLKLLYETFKTCRKSKSPTLVIAHTIKGWGLRCAAAPGNHSLLPDDDEVDALRESEGIPAHDLFHRFPEGSAEDQFLSRRSSYFHEGIASQKELKLRNLEMARAQIESVGGLPDRFQIDLKLVPWANTQWMWGQLAARLVRLANADGTTKLSELDQRWKPVSQYLATMAPDVGTSTNLNPSMDGKIYGPESPDFEEQYQVKDSRRPDLVPLERQSNRHLRFEIEEGNSMTCAGSFGKLKDVLGIPVLPLMSVYDFFIKRALDQLFYNVYWKSGFILLGTPSGVSLSPEGAQHSWKSDLQIPNLITWEPAFSLELDWIFADAVNRHFAGNNQGRESVLIRAVTMGIEQKLLIESLRAQKRFEGQPDDSILEATKADALQGGYWVVNHEGADGYAPGDNVVHLFAMGTLVPEAIHASRTLLEQGVFANVIAVTSPELLCGNLGALDGFKHLRENLRVTGDLYLNRRTSVSGQGAEIQSVAELLSLRGARIPLVSSHDGEPGLLDNLGSIVGVPHETLAVRKHSKSGRPVDVFGYHHIDAHSIVEAAHRALATTATEEIRISPEILSAAQNAI